MCQRSSRIAAWLLCGLLGAPLGAQARDLPSFRFSGFGTLGYAATDRKNAEYRLLTARDGADKSGSLELDTRLGLQVDGQFTRQLSATVQLQARERADGDPGAELEWAFLRWRPGDRTSIRAGRMGLSVLSLSDFRAVGYANVPIRPPSELYSQSPVERFDGADITFEGERGDTLWRLQALAGQSETTYSGVDLDARNMINVALELERGSARLRLSHFRADTTVHLDGLGQIRDALTIAAALDPELARVRDDFALDEILVTISAAALFYDRGDWFADAEYARRRAEGYTPGVASWAVTAGVRFGAFTPYALVAGYRDTDPDRRAQLPPVQQLAPLQSLLDEAYTKADQRSVGVGLRWDAYPNIAFKGQVEHVASRFVGNNLRHVNDSDPIPDGADVTLFAVSMDVVF